MAYPFDDEQPAPRFGFHPNPFGQDFGPQPESFAPMLAPGVPIVSEPNYLTEFAGQQEQAPGDYWARVAQGTGGQAPFGPARLGQKPTGLEVLLALASGFANAKTGQAAGRISETDQRNTRAREAGKTLATWRQEERRAKQKAEDNKALVAENRSYQERLKNTPPSEAELKGIRARAEAGAGGKREGAPLAGARERMVQVIGPDGFPVWTAQSDALGERSIVTGKSVTGADRQALAFYNRAKEAVEAMAYTDKSGRSLEERVANTNVGSQAQAEYAPNVLKSPDQRLYRQAQRSFTEARLRKESGAAIPVQEYANDRNTYFAQTGDHPELIEQKRKMRQTVLDGLRFASGRAYDEFYGTTQPEPVGATTTRKPAPGSGPVDAAKVDAVWEKIQARRAAGGKK